MQVQSLIFPSSGHGRGFRTRSSNGSIGLRKPRRGQTRKMMSPSFWWLSAWFKGHRIVPRGGSLCSGAFLRKMLVASWRYTYNDTAWCLIQEISQETRIGLAPIEHITKSPPATFLYQLLNCQTRISLRKRKANPATKCHDGRKQIKEGNSNRAAVTQLGIQRYSDYSHKGLNELWNKDNNA